MATANRTEWPDSIRLGGALANDVGELIPFVDTIYTVTKIIVEYVQAAEANHESCEKLAERATSISNTLRTYFGTKDDADTNGAYDVKDSSIFDCLSELERELHSACSLVKRFSSPKKWTGKAIRALTAKTFQVEFLTCEARLVELETRLSRIIILKISHEQKQNHEEQMQNHREQKQDCELMIGKLEAVLHKLENNSYEMFRGFEADMQRGMTEHENKLRSRPAKGAELSMRGVEMASADPFSPAANSRHASNELEGSEPWYVEAARAEKNLIIYGTRVRFIPVGDSSSGNIFKGKFMGQEVAIKEMRFTGNRALAALRNEVGTMWVLSHGNVVQTRGGFYPRKGVKAHEHESPFILLEYAPRGSLEKYMFHESENSLLSREELLRIFRCILDGLKYLHGEKIIHRDMKPQSVLLMDDWTPKISDFGLATVNNSCSFSKPKHDIFGYMAPEVIRRKQYSRSCDVWSYGVMLFEMMLGETMFGSESTFFDILEALEDPKLGVPWDRLNQSEYAKQWPAWVVKLAKACLQTTPEKRPTISDILLEFNGRMGSEGAVAAAKSQTAQYSASPSNSSTAKVDAVAGKFSHVTVASRESEASASSTRGGAAEPSGSRPVQAPNADDMLRYAEEWEKAGNMAYAYAYFKLAAEAGVAEGQFRLGKILLDGSHGMGQHLEYGAGWVRAAAENEHTDAMIEYGRCHHSGRGVPQNLSLAKEWYAKAAKLGSPAGSEWLKTVETEEQTALRRQQNEAEKRRLEEDKKKAERDRQALEHAAAVHRRDAEEHDPFVKKERLIESPFAEEQERLEKEEPLIESMFDIVGDAAWLRDEDPFSVAARLYGDAVDRQPFGRAAEHNEGLMEELESDWNDTNPFASRPSRMTIHFNDVGCGLQTKDSAGLYQGGARQRYFAAPFPMSPRSGNSWDGLLKNEISVVDWCAKAAEHGNAWTKNRLKNCNDLGTGGLAEDKRAVVELWLEAAEQGDAEAQCKLGYFFESGWGGLPQDKRAAVEWYRKAADQGDAEAQFKLGFFYESGFGGLPQDKRAAHEWYTKAAEQGDALAQYYLKRHDH